jgi:ABC-type branched-subunit amino acid transport system substrate-binding protein
MHRRFGAVVAALALVAVAVACSGERGQDESGGSSGTGGATTEQAAGDGGDTFGTLPSPCSDGVGTAPEAPATDGSETQGIHADEIRVGTFSDVGFEGRPGLNQELFDSGEAFVEWCNEQGGINGRQLELTEYDAAITEYAPRMQEACTSEFALVGGGGAQDSEWETTGEACGLVDITGFAATPEKAGVVGHEGVIEHRTVSSLPYPQDEFSVGGLNSIIEESGDAIEHVGVIAADFATLTVIADRTKEAYSQLGAEIVSDQTYNVLGESNWAPLAAVLERDGVQWLNFIGEGQYLALLQQALVEIGYQPTVTVEDPSLYSATYLDAAGPAAEGTFVPIPIWPFEEADENPATQLYLDLIDGVGGDPSLLGVQSMSSWLLFATAADACDDDGDLTRTCLLETAASQTEWDGGGLHGPTNPSTNQTPPCTILMQVEDGAFARHAPDDGYDCDDDSIAVLEGDYSSTN